jgi:hypothetical protein
MVRNFNSHAVALPAVELRGFGYTTATTPASLPGTGQPGEIRNVNGKLYFWNNVQARWVPHSSVSRVRAVATTVVTTATPPPTIDGVTLAAGDLVLLTAQSAANNGVYRYPASGAMARAPGFAANEMGEQVFICSLGTNNAGIWTTPEGLIVGGNPINLTKIAPLPVRSVWSYPYLKEFAGAINADITDDIAAGRIAVGDAIETSNYYQTNEAGGGNYYQVVAAGTGTDNGGSFVNVGAVQLQATFRERFVSIAAFGARCNGTTDDTAAWNAAIAYINSRPGLPFTLFSPGRSLVSAPLTPITVSYLTLLGTARGYPSIITADAITAGYVINFNGPAAAGGTITGLTIRDFCIAGESVSTSNCHGIRLNRVHQSHFTNLRVYNLNGMAIHASHSYDNNMVGAILARCGEATSQVPALRFDAEDLADKNTGCNNWDIIGLTIEGALWRGMELRKHSTRNRLWGKFHGLLPTPVDAEHLVMTGATANMIVNTAFSTCATNRDQVLLDIEDGLTSNGNSFVNCSFQVGGWGLTLQNADNTGVDNCVFGTDLVLALGSARMLNGTNNRWGHTNRTAITQSGAWVTVAGAAPTIATVPVTGDGATTSFAVVHNLALATPFQPSAATVLDPSGNLLSASSYQIGTLATNQFTVTFAVAPANGSVHRFRVTA